MFCLFLQRSLDDTIDEICDRYLSQMEVDSPGIKKVTENIQDVLDSNIDSSESKKSKNSLEKSSTTKNILSAKKELIFDSPREPDLEPKSQEEEKLKQYAAPSGGVLIIEPKQNNLKKSEVESPFLDLEKIEAVKRELKFDMAEPEPDVEPPKKPKIQQKEPKAFDDLVKVA